jgi:Rod binding domain-containing protein
MPNIPANMPAGLSAKWVEQPVPKNVTDPQTFRAARGFEAHFAQYMVKQMQGSTSLIGGEGLGGEMYNSIFTEVLGDQIASKGALGITDLIYRQLMQKNGTEPYSEISQSTEPELFQAPSADLQAMMNSLDHSPTSDFQTIADDTASRYNLDPRLVHAVIRAESNWDSTAISGAGAVGLMQLMPETAADLGVNNSLDPGQNIDGGARYLRQMLERYDGDIPTALAAYNAGPTAVDEHGGIPPYEETQNYVNKIMSWLAASGSADMLIRDSQTAQQAREYLATPQPETKSDGETAEEDVWNRS